LRRPFHVPNIYILHELLSISIQGRYIILFIHPYPIRKKKIAFLVFVEWNVFIGGSYSSCLFAYRPAQSVPTNKTNTYERVADRCDISSWYTSHGRYYGAHIPIHHGVIGTKRILKMMYPRASSPSYIKVYREMYVRWSQFCAVSLQNLKSRIHRLLSNSKVL